MIVPDLWAEGPPLRPSQLAALLGVTTRYVRKLIHAGALPGVRLPNLGRSGRRDLGRLLITREAARALAADLGMGPNGNSGNSGTQTLDAPRCVGAKVVTR